MMGSSSSQINKLVQVRVDWKAHRIACIGMLSCRYFRIDGIMLGSFLLKTDSMNCFLV